MKHAKRLLSVVLALAMLLAMAACTAEPEPQEEQEPAGTPVVETPEEDAAEEGAQAPKDETVDAVIVGGGGAGMTTREAMKQFSKIGNFASDHGIAMCGSISLPFISPFEGEGVIPMDRLEDIIRGFMDIGIREISLSDAAGLGDPAMIYERFSTVAEHFPDVSWMLHMHNTWGMGLAGVLAALQAGVTKFDASVAGLGGCPYLPGATGNVATEDLAFMLNRMGIETGIDVEKLIPAGKKVREIVDNRGTDSVIQRNFEKFPRFHDLMQV